MFGMHAKYGPSAMVTLDASWDVERNAEGKPCFDEDGNVQKVVCRAGGVVCEQYSGGVHDFGAPMVEETGADNYLGEMAAQLDALDLLPPGGKVVIVFDATSPVTALEAFKKACSRARNRYYAGVGPSPRTTEMTRARKPPGKQAIPKIWV